MVSCNNNQYPLPCLVPCLFLFGLFHSDERRQHYRFCGPSAKISNLPAAISKILSVAFSTPMKLVIEIARVSTQRLSVIKKIFILFFVRSSISRKEIEFSLGTRNKPKSDEMQMEVQNSLQKDDIHSSICLSNRLIFWIVPRNGISGNSSCWSNSRFAERKGKMVGIMGVNQSNAVQVCCRLGLLLVVSAAAADAKLDATRQQPVTRHHLHTFLPGNGLIEKTITIRGGGAIGTNAKTPSKTVAARGGGEEEGASVPNEIFNLVKSIVGAGVLGLPAGIAAFGNTKIALVPSMILIAIAGMLSAYGFSIIGRVCAYTHAHSYRDAWEQTVGSKTSWIPAAACFLVTVCSVLAYSMILSDTIPSLAQSFLGIQLSRTQALLGITVPVLLPLCLMKSLKALAPFSLVGITGMIYTSCAMAFRYFDGSYSEGGKFFDGLTVKPQFGSSSTTLLETISNPSIFVLISMLSTAFMAHYNAPKFYWELENNTLERYQLVVNASFCVAMLMFMAVATFGFGTFGTACTGLVLNNYSTQDQLMSLSRIGVLISLVFSYPLAFVGVRNGILDLFQIKDRPNSILNSVTVGALTLITGLAYCLNDLRKLLAFNGATWGNAVIYLLPSYMFIQCTKSVKPELKSEIPFVVLTAILGIGMGIVGTVQAIGS